MYGATWQFNQAVRIRGGDLLFVSGIVGLAPDGSIATNDIVEQSQVAFQNLSMVLEAAGGSVTVIEKKKWVRTYPQKPKRTPKKKAAPEATEPEVKETPEVSEAMLRRSSLNGVPCNLIWRRPMKGLTTDQEPVWPHSFDPETAGPG